MGEFNGGELTQEFNEVAQPKEATVETPQVAEVDLTREFNEAAGPQSAEAGLQGGASEIDLTREFNDAAKPPDEGGDDFDTLEHDLNPPSSPEPKF